MEIIWPEVTDLDIAFPAEIPEKAMFIKMADEAGFEDRWNNKYCRYFSQLFFKGGKVSPRKDISKEYFNKGMRYFKVWAGSFEPQHEDKEMVCGFILSKIAQVD